MWRRELVHEAELEPRVARLKVRGVHVGFMESRLDTLGILRRRNASDPPPTSWSRCVPLIWWPLWAYNIGEFFQNSAAGVAELLAAGVIPNNTMLVPEVGGWPLRDFQSAMLEALTMRRVRTLGQLAPRCGRRDRACPPPRCFERVLLCRFRDVYDGTPPVSPWSAARSIVSAFRRPGRWPLRGALAEPGQPPPFVVLFASRKAAKNGARLLLNEADLLRICSQWLPPPPCAASAPPAAASDPSPSREGGGGRTRCSARVFGQRGFRADALAMQVAHAPCTCTCAMQVAHAGCTCTCT